jgi:hypothetical protein
MMNPQDFRMLLEETNLASHTIMNPLAVMQNLTNKFQQGPKQQLPQERLWWQYFSLGRNF